MLLNLSNGTLNSPFVMLVDSAEEKGRPLLLALVKSLAKSTTQHILVLCWEECVRNYERLLNDLQLSNVHVHECLTHFQEWQRDVSPGSNSVGFLSCLSRFTASHKGDVIVVIDSLSSLIFSYGYGISLQELRLAVEQPIRNGTRMTQLLCVVHRDVLPAGLSTLPLLKHLPSTCIELRNGQAHTTHRKPGGHIEKKREKFTILRTGELRVSALTVPATKTDAADSTPAKLPQDVASFRVGLSDSEREARSQLILPYLRVEQHNEGGDSRGGGKIFYQPDASDDWDEEDPDDDLDI